MVDILSLGKLVTYESGRLETIYAHWAHAIWPRGRGNCSHRMNDEKCEDQVIDVVVSAEPSIRKFVDEYLLAETRKVYEPKGAAALRKTIYDHAKENMGLFIGDLEAEPAREGICVTAEGNKQIYPWGRGGRGVQKAMEIRAKVWNRDVVEKVWTSSVCFDLSAPRAYWMDGAMILPVVSSICLKSNG